MALSRFDDKTVGGRFRLTDIDLSVLRLLNRYRYLPSNYIGALLGMHGKYYQDVLYKLRRKAGLIYCPSASWSAANARYRPAVYALSKKGAAALQRHALYVLRDKTGHEFNHELGVCLVEALFALGAKACGLDLLTAQDILEHPRFPTDTRLSKNPWAVPVTIDWKSQGSSMRCSQTVETDGDFFVLAHTHGNGRRTLAFPGFEFDRRTEPLEPQSYERSSIKKKLLAFTEIVRQRRYQSQFGLPNQLIAFVTINEQHMRSIMRLAQNVSGHESNVFIFRTVSNFASFENFPPPTAHLLTQPWERADGSRFSIVDALKTEPA